MSDIKLIEIPKYKKFQLASIVGYTIEITDERTGRCKIVGADNYIDNDFKNIDDVLKYISGELRGKGFNIAA